MGNTNGNVKTYARKALAVFSAAALLLTGSAVGTATLFSENGITANAASASVATQLKIYDENGKDISDDPIIYVDNSKAGGLDAITERTVKVVASDENGNPVNDRITGYVAHGATDHIRVVGSTDGTKSVTFTIQGGYSDNSGSNEKWVSLKSGTTTISLTTESGEVYRKITVVVYNPATDMTVSQAGTKLDLNDFNTSNACTTMTIANHKYQFSGAKVPTNSTDEVEWYVYDGFYEGSGKPKETTKAEITPQGLFTAKANGQVTIVAKYKATETSKREAFYGTKKIKAYDDNGKEKTETLQNYRNGPKYIHVTIVKENPAKSLKITDAPEALEINEEFQLTYEAEPTYKGDGYDTGATDEYRWESSNENVITVDDKGLIKAVGKGDAKITVYGENENVRAECDIRVVTKATSIKFSPSGSVSTKVGSDSVITAIMDPSTADEEIVWSSSDDKIATVRSIVDGAYTNSQSAIITGVSQGTVTITARAKNSGVESRLTCNVQPRVNSADIKLTTEESGEISTINDGTLLKIFDQKLITINGILVGEDGKTTSDNDHITWEVLGNGDNNGDYVQIVETDPLGKFIKLKGFDRGTVQVRAKSTENPSINKTFNLQILKRATLGSIVSAQTSSDKFIKSYNVGDGVALKGVIKIKTNHPYDHDDSIVKWTSSNENVAIVDNNGYVQIVGNGKSTIAFITASGCTANVTITGFTTGSVVISGNGIEPSEGDELPYTTVSLNENSTGTTKLSATIYNEGDNPQSDAAVKYWDSDNYSVATVDSTGTVTAHAIGEAVITVRSGNKTDSVKIIVTDPIKNSDITIGSDTIYYSPDTEKYEPDIEVLDQQGTLLTKDVDYTVSYSNNTKVGNATVTITGIGHYTGTATKNFKISARPINDGEITIAPIDDQEITMDNKSGVKPALTVKHQGYTLVEGTDYTVSYSNNRKPAKSDDTAPPTITISGRGNYSDRTSTYFTIYCNHKTTTEKITKQPTYTATGEKTTTCSICGYQTIAVIPMLEKVNISKCTVTLSKTSFVNNGSTQKPTVTVKYNSTTLKLNTDYTLTYSNSNSKDVGTYTVTVTGKNGYTGTKSVSYKITAASASSVKLSKTSVTLDVGKSETIKATVSPDYASNKTVTWTTSNSKVATVSAGKITAKAAGTAKITAKTSNGKTATCNVTVKAPNPTSVKLSKTSVSLNKGQSTTIKATVGPTGASQTVTWSSSNTKVATVSNGKITAKAVGSATITAKTSNGKSATCKVTVKNSTVSVTSVKLSKTSLTLTKGKSTTLKATVNPSNATNKKVTWSTSNKKVATVTSSGKITAKAAGSATITVKTSNGKKATCKVTVKNAVSPTKVKLSKTSVTLGKGKSTTLKATVSPSNATNKKVTWSTSNKKVATVTSSGKITAKGVGTATITVKTSNGKKATCRVTVKNLPTKVKLSKTSASLKKGKSVTLKATVTPSKNVINTVTWSTSNKKVATVKNGKVTAKAKGTAYITVKTTNGKTAKCKITVK